jgi:hypothetical protein
VTRKTLLPFFALLLIGADGPDDPDAPTADSPEEDVPAASDAPSVDEPASETVTTETRSPGEIALAQATEYLTQRRWTEALTIAITGVSAYPAQAESFRLVSQLASEQIARGPTFNAPGGITAPPAQAPSATDPYAGWTSERPLAIPAEGAEPAQPTERQDSWRSSRWREDRAHPAANDPREGILVGFDAGLNNGVRVEWKAKGRTVDGVGLQAGLGTWIYSGVYLAPMTQIYVDFQSRSDFQFETSLGILWASGSAYPLIGIGGQWDPPKPIQVNVGVDVGVGVFPDVSVGFLW